MSTSCVDLPGECELNHARCAGENLLEICTCADNGQFLIGNCRNNPPRWQTIGPCRDDQICVQNARGGAVCVEENRGPCIQPDFEERCLDDMTALICETFVGQNVVAGREGQAHYGVATTRSCFEGEEQCRIDFSGFASCWLE